MLNTVTLSSKHAFLHRKLAQLSESIHVSAVSESAMISMSLKGNDDVGSENSFFLLHFTVTPKSLYNLRQSCSLCIYLIDNHVNIWTFVYMNNFFMSIA